MQLGYIMTDGLLKDIYSTDSTSMVVWIHFCPDCPGIWESSGGKLVAFPIPFVSWYYAHSFLALYEESIQSMYLIPMTFNFGGGNWSQQSGFFPGKLTIICSSPHSIFLLSS